MIEGYTKYFRSLLIYSIVISMISIGMNRVVPEKIHVPVAELSGLFIFFFITTAALHYFLMKAAQGRPQEFVRAFTGAFALKIGLYFILLLSYGLLNRPGLKRFAIAFLFLYAWFMIYEVLALLKQFKKQTKA